MAPRFTRPRCVVRKGGLAEDLYLQRDGTWGGYATAHRFKSAAEAEPHAEPGHGVFDCSTPRRLA